MKLLAPSSSSSPSPRRPLVAGCGGGSSSRRRRRRTGEPGAEDAPVFLEANLAPEAKESEALTNSRRPSSGSKTSANTSPKNSKRRRSAKAKSSTSKKKSNRGWAKRSGSSLNEFDGNNFTGAGIALETTNSGEAEEFIEKRVEEGNEKAEEGEFEGDKYYVSRRRRIGDRRDRRLLRARRNEGRFEEMVDDRRGRQGQPRRIGEVHGSDGSGRGEGLGSVYVDIGGLIEEAKSQIPPETEAVFDLIGIEPRDATAVATVVPHSEQVEIDFSTNVTKASTPDRRRLGAARIAARDRGGRLRHARIRQELRRKPRTNSTKTASPARSNRAS